MGKGLSYLKNWGIWVNYCWNYGPSKLLLHFIEYRLDQLNNKHTKIAVNSAIQYFEGHSQKKCLLKVWPLNFFFAKLNGKHLLRWNKMHFFSIFQGLSVARNYLRPEIAPSTLLAVKIGLCVISQKVLTAAVLWDKAAHA